MKWLSAVRFVAEKERILGAELHSQDFLVSAARFAIALMVELKSFTKPLPLFACQSSRQSLGNCQAVRAREQPEYRLIDPIAARRLVGDIREELFQARPCYKTFTLAVVRVL